MNQGHARKLQAILAADVVGYSRLMNRDEERTLTRLQAQEREVVDPSISDHGGEVVKRLGDGLLAVFPSAVTALRAARAIQVKTAALQAGEAEPIIYRIGLNVGDVIVTDNDIFGDGVNIAARLEGLADPGGIALSAAVHDNVRAQDPGPFDDLGERQVKNIEHPIRVYRVHFDDSPALPAAAGTAHGTRRLLLVAGLLATIAMLAWVFWPEAEVETPAPVMMPAPAPVPEAAPEPTPAPVVAPTTPVVSPTPVVTPESEPVVTAPRRAPPPPRQVTTTDEPAPVSRSSDTTKSDEPSFSERLFDSVAEAVEAELKDGISNSGSSSKSPGKSKSSSKGKGKNK